ncbi:MAG: aldose 1-epimerase [Solirubrobacterales bacterium]|nr:aldose 1-epimerase [Solirubrobacterales bacterium]
MPSEYSIKMARVAGMRAWSLSDAGADLHCTWVPGAGMLGASLVQGGEELLWQGAGVRAYARERKFMGIPFLHPWANRLDGFEYEARGHHVVLDPRSPQLLLDDHGLPIHGVLTGSRRWVVQEVTADGDRARLVSSLDFDRPELLEAFPFPHRVELAVEVSGGAVQVRTTLTATGSEPVPVAFGFHPYFRLPGLPRARWEVLFPVHERLPLDPLMVPTGATEPARPLTGGVGERTWDDEFDGVEPGACFQLSGGGRTIEVHYTDGYPVAQIFAPPGTEYVCIEPMTSVANALEGPDDELQWVPVGEHHSATFRIVCRRDMEAGRAGR